MSHYHIRYKSKKAQPRATNFRRILSTTMAAIITMTNILSQPLSTSIFAVAVISLIFVSIDPLLTVDSQLDNGYPHAIGETLPDQPIMGEDEVPLFPEEEQQLVSPKLQQQQQQQQLVPFQPYAQSQTPGFRTASPPPIAALQPPSSTIIPPMSASPPNTAAPPYLPSMLGPPLSSAGNANPDSDSFSSDSDSSAVNSTAADCENNNNNECQDDSDNDFQIEDFPIDMSPPDINW